MQLIVAEKPSVARDLARVLGVRPRGEHRFDGERVITWCIGHLVELDEPSAYDGRWKPWRLDTLPMFPEAFQLRASKHAREQLRAVARLMKERRFTAIVNACDAGREGELIFRYVYQFSGARLPVRRLWISSMTDEAIRRGLAALRPPATALADAARSRSEADWLVGMNATRAITVRGGGTLLSIGRVQTPTLAMLVARERAIAAFVAEPYCEIKADYGFVAWWRLGKRARLDEPVARAIVARDRGAPAVVASVASRTVREPPPLLFDLTALQRTANKRFKLSAARTLEIAQALYERHKVLTYPRTDSRYLTRDEDLAGRFAALAQVPAYAPFAQPLVDAPPRPSRRVVDDAKVHDHHAIIPTGTLAALSGDEQRIFDLVARRFLAVFHPDAELAVVEAWIRVGPPGAGPRTDGTAEERVTVVPPPPDRYLARGRTRLVAGWQTVAGIEPAKEDGEPLPPLVDGQALTGTYTVIAKQTTPPPHFTDATLLAAMESAGKEVTDEALRAAMKECGLGTPATRAAIIETLVAQGAFVARDKQALVATPTGIALIGALGGDGVVGTLASPELTGAWEARLAAIARGTDSRDAFMADIRRYVTQVVGAIRATAPPSASPAPPVGACPKCGGEVAPRRYAFGCGSCGFSIRDRVAGRVLSPALVAVLLRRRETQVLRGFRSKAGKKFSAKLVLDEAGEVRFVFDERGGERERTTERRDDGTTERRNRSENPKLACPRCRSGHLIAGSRGWGCTRWREGCRFVVWFLTGGQRVTAAQLATLVTKGKTRKTRAGRFVLDVEVDNGAARLEPG